MRGHCVVIGGGIGGLLAARVLADRFDRVTVLERRSYLRGEAGEVPAARRGAPQSRCLHLLMAAGVAAFDAIDPVWKTTLVGLGAVPFDASADTMMRVSGGWLPRAPSGIVTYACSRSLIETALGLLVRAKPNVRIVEGCHVAGLAGLERGGRVTGVRVAAACVAAETVLAADLTVDASGAGSALPRWIAVWAERAGESLEATRVETGTEYVSRWYRLHPEDAPGWHCLSIAPTPASGWRCGMMMRAEHGMWGVVLLARSGVKLPTDDETFLAFTAELGEGELRTVLDRAKPASPIHRYGPTCNRWTHAERLRSWPAGLVAIGDAVCALDPYFGLGMTVTARSVVMLGSWLDRGDPVETDCHGFQRGLAALNAAPWRLATRLGPGGSRAASDPAHIGRLYAAAPHSRKIAHAILAVQHMLLPPEHLMELDAA